MNFLTKIEKLLFKDDVEEKAIFKTTFNIAWPAILESFLIQLTAFLDSIMVSTLGLAAIAAVGLTIQPKLIALAVFTSIGVTMSALIARRHGEGDRESANKILRMSLFIGCVLLVIITIGFIVAADWIINLCGSEPDTHDMAVEYFRIVIAGLAFSVISILINAGQRGAGRTRIAMITNVSSNVVNVIFNYLLIGGNFGFPALGIKGAAIATVIGSVVACVLSVISITKPDGFLYIKAVKGFIANKKDIKSAKGIFASAFVEQIFIRIGFLLFALTVANLGTTQFAAHQIGANFMSLSFAFADGLAVASVALVGRSLGEKRLDLAKKYATTCFKIGLMCAVVVSIIFFTCGESLYRLFDSDEVVLSYGTMIMNILCFVIYAQILQISIIGCLRGSGDNKYTALISLICVGIIRPFASWFLCYPVGLGLLGVWLGLCVDQCLRLVLSYLRFKKGDWLKIKI